MKTKLNNWLRWVPGRQGTGYAKMLLATSSWPIGFDLYLLRYEKGQGITRHTDPVPGKRHYRINVELIRGKGGQFHCEGQYRKWGPMIFFRSDINPHWVDPVEEGRRIVVSLGWVLRNKNSA